MRRHAAVAVLAILLPLAGCGDAAGVATVGSPAPGNSKAASCAGNASALALPPGFPTQVPLPAGVVVTGVESRSEGRLIVTAVAPADFRTTLAFMQQAYPAAGLALKAGEVDPGDAESDFAGNGLTGRWTLRKRPGCADTEVTVLVAKGASGSP